MTNSRILTLALIGAGRWGTNIQRTLAAMPTCTLKYVETHEWQRLLRAPDLDGVLIATPGSTHARIALPFIERGVPTFIEKPLTTSLRDALALARAARRSRTPVLVGHIHLYNPAFLKAKALARRAGRIRYIVGEGTNNGPVRDDMSVHWDRGPHDLSMTLDLLGTEPTTVQAWGACVLRPRTRLVDTAQLHLTFPGNVHGFYTFSWLAPEKRLRLTIVGEHDTIVYDDTAERKVTAFRGMGPRVRGTRVVHQEPRVLRPPYADTTPLTQGLENFLDCIRGGRQPRVGLYSGVAVVRILDAAEKSLRSRGRTVRF